MCVHSGVPSTAVHQCNTSGVLGCQHWRHQSLWEMQVPEPQRTVRWDPGTSVLSGPLGFDRDRGIVALPRTAPPCPAGRWGMGSNPVGSWYYSGQQLSLKKTSALSHTGPEIVKAIFAVAAEAASQSGTSLSFAEFLPNTGWAYVFLAHVGQCETKAAFPLLRLTFPHHWRENISCTRTDFRQSWNI